jgi:hypothetical protein
MTVAQAVARHTGAKRQHNGWWVTKWIYHEDKKPSLNFKKKGYHCFGCPAKGHINKLAEDLGIREPKSFPGNGKSSLTFASTTVDDAMRALRGDRGLRQESIERVRHPV